MSETVWVKSRILIAKMTYYLKQTKKKQHLGCVWFRREIVKRERGEKEYEKREK